MITDVVTLSKGDNLKQGRHLMRDLGIRHIPVLDENNHIAGLMTDRIVLSAVFRLINMHGAEEWKAHEDKVLVNDIMAPDFDTVGPEMPLDQACEFFIENKYGCLLVMELQKLVGIVTAADFVKLAKHLLDKS